MTSRGGSGADTAVPDLSPVPSEDVRRAGALSLTASCAMVVAVVVGCGGAGDRDVAKETTSVVSPTPVASPSRTIAVTSRARALEVIRTRIADKAHGSALDEPSPRVQPPLKVEVGEDGFARVPDMGLEWTGRPAGLFDLEDARAYCHGLEGAGEATVRLPRIEELEAIVGADPAICGGGGSLELWSATPGGERGVQTWDCRTMARSRRAVGMAHVVCVRRWEG